MRIAVFGTGTVGRALAGALAERGHEVTVGTRDPGETAARTGPDRMGRPPFSEWQARYPEVGLADYAGAAADAELVVNATSGAGSLPALGAAGASRLAGKVLVDVSNPLDFSQGCRRS
jgi:predicted dinucleotide-binding enzyme